MKRTVKGVLRRLLGPLIAYIGVRFDDTTARLSDLERQVNGRLDIIQDQWTAMNHRLEDFQREIATDVQTAVEVMLTQQRTAAAIRQQMDEIKELLPAPSATLETQQGSSGQTTTTVKRPG